MWCRNKPLLAANIHLYSFVGGENECLLMIHSNTTKTIVLSLLHDFYPFFPAQVFSAHSKNRSRSINWGTEHWIAEPGTQMTWENFHFAVVASMLMILKCVCTCFTSV
jgi:hypothetical protein